MAVHRSFRSALSALAILGWCQLLAPRGVSSFAPPGGERRVSTHPQRSVGIGGITGSFDGESSTRTPPLPISTRGHRRSSRVREVLATASSTEEETEELTPATIAEMVEVSFLQSCLQLSQGYIDVLKLFIVAVKAGYEFPMPLEELHSLVLECPVNSAGRDLMKEELDLRLEWMTVVYRLLDALNSDPVAGGECGEGDAASDRVSGVVDAMLSLRDALKNEEANTGGKADATVALSNLTVEQALEKSPSLSAMNASLASDPMGKAFLTNDIRVGLMTFRVLQEEKVCVEGASGLKGEVPRPPIPGT